ncbi:glycosyltransferase [Vibrio fluvialis]|nr:glycosyltransferase [Vibrio fluvialis]
MIDNLLISVVIPHFNSHKSLRNLVESIPDDNRIEIIVVDDNSDVELNAFFFSERTNVRTYLNPGKKGAGSARNYGMTKCRGEWLLFADADDYFTANAFDVVFRDINTTTSDIVFYKPISWNIDSEVSGSRHQRYEELVLDFIKYKSFDASMNLKIKYLVPWSKLIKKDLVYKNNINFDEVMFSNDVMFSVKIGLSANEIDVKEDVIYCVTENNTSLTKTKNFNSFKTRLDVMFRFNDYLKNYSMNKYCSPLLSYLIWSKNFGFKVFASTLFSMVYNKQKIIPNLKIDYLKSPQLILKKFRGYK